MTFRTQVFEPLAIAALAWLLPGRDAIPGWIARASRYLLAVSLIVFGVDHFLALAPIGTLIPPDSMARVLDRILRGWIHRRGF
jgi:hypothetical protein